MEETNKRKRLSAQDRRKQLLGVAVELFSKRGFEGTTTKAIAAAAGVSEGIIFQHFASKDELYADILDYQAEATGIEESKAELLRCAERCDDEGVVRSLVGRILKDLRLNPEFHRLMYHAALSGHSLPQIMAERRLPFFSYLRDYITIRQKQGAFQKCDPDAAVLAMLSIPIHFAVCQSVLGLNVLTLSEEEMTETFTRLILYGLRGDPKSRSKRERKS